VLAPVVIQEKPLSKKHKLFIAEFVATGDDLQAWENAGYKVDRTSKNKARKLRTRLASHIEQALVTYIKSTDLAIMAVAVVADLAKDAGSDAVRLAAAKDILSRGGHDVEKEVTIKHETKDMSNDAIDKRLAELKAELWADAPTLEIVSEQ
tara:strand:+ start:117 stop:569 length:453 start_codon:yes stop_codon:yes gene_type:complete